MVNGEFWRGKKVLITGHTGFKGAWLSLWLSLLNAKITGFALPPPTVPSLFELAGVKDHISSRSGDVRNLELLQKAFATDRPEIVIHMAAQSLVRRSYADPIETFSTNIMGTVNVLEAIRQVEGVRVVIIVTSDKCYDNREWIWGYRENDPLGGFDPYSSSKGSAELVTSAFRNSFFNPSEYDRHGVAIASVRAGNVIGGGDWAEDRLIPDIMRAILEHRTIEIRNPNSYRPWQHVLEPLKGYLMLAEKLYDNGPNYAEAWNFGSNNNDLRPVSWVLEKIVELWGPGVRWESSKCGVLHEAQFLSLDCSKAKLRLGWQPKLRLEEALNWTVSWYKDYQSDPALALKATESQIINYQKVVANIGED
jgi:CDP-glucose 4,6-dehydratase